jgi:CRP-like cAMP-binding protein
MRAEGVFRNADTTKDVPGGTIIFTEGDAGNEMYGVVAGEVEMLVGDEVIDKLGPNEIFGEMALVDSSPRMATARTTTDTTLAVINQRHFLFLVHETPTFALQVMSCMAERLRRGH